MVDIGISPFELVQVWGDGNDASKLNFVFVADGFTENEFGGFEAFTKKIAEYLFAYDEATENQKEAWNVFALLTPSNESGISYEYGNDPQYKVDNRYGSYFYCQGIERLLCINQDFTIFDDVEAAVPNWDNILVVANNKEDGRQGGGGYMDFQLATSTRNDGDNKIIVHEMGHAWANLQDEYAYTPHAPTPTNEYKSANLTIYNDPNTVKWKAWLGEKTSNGDVIDFYEGGASNVPSGVWKGTSDSFMQHQGAPFEQINREAWLLKAYNVKGIISDYYPANDAPTVAIDGKAIFEVNPLLPKNVSIEWFVDGVLQQSATDELIFEFFISNESAEVSVTVTDNTGWIRTDLNGDSTATITWQVCKEAQPCNP